MAVLTADMLIAGCRDDSIDAGITIRTPLEPVGGEGTPIKPATYAGGQFQRDRRWWGEGDDRRPVDIVVIDNEPSQANRLEAVLEERRVDLGIPEITLDLSSAGTLPAHLPRRISSFRFPHRNADAYLRDAVLDGKAFLSSDPGRAIFDATADRPEALLQWCPQALLFGFWQSLLGKKRSQAKLARAWASEIIGVEPAADGVRRLGLKGDPLNLSVVDRVKFDENDLVHGEWHFSGTGKKLAEVGHGQVPVADEEAPPSGVSFRELVQQSTVSFASLRRVRPSTGAAEARALLAALGVVAHVSAFGRPFSLRSGADLRPGTAQWRWLGAGRDEILEAPDDAHAVSIFVDCVERAEAEGAPVGGRWARDPLMVEPAPSLLEAIQKSWPTD